MAFSRESIEAVGDDWGAIARLNALIARLEHRKVSSVAIDPAYAEPGLVWQIRIFNQGAIHRVVDLANGGTQAWNGRNVLGAVLFARSLVETCVLVFDLEVQIQRLVRTSDFAGARRLLTNRTLASKEPEVVERNPDIAAVNVLTLINKHLKTFPTLMDTYNFLSEMCHPNSEGAFGFFGMIDGATGLATFSYSKRFTRPVFNQVVIAFILMELVDNSINKLEQVISDHLTNPTKTPGIAIPHR